LYSEITTGMSAPPIGSVIRMPTASAQAKKPTISGVDSVKMAAMPKPIAARNTSALNHCCPGKV